MTGKPFKLARKRGPKNIDRMLELSRREQAEREGRVKLPTFAFMQKPEPPAGRGQ